MKSTARKIIVYDLETGGLKHELHAITEVAAVVVDMKNFEIVEEYSSLIKPYDENLTYTDEAFAVSHLSMEVIENEGRESSVVIGELIDLFKRHTTGNSKPILAGHNIKGFDNQFLINFIARSKKDLSKLVDLENCIDTLKWAQLRWFELANYGLGTCANEVDLTLKEAHRALPDTQANTQFLIKLLQNLRGEGVKEIEYKRRKFNFNF